MIETGGGAVRIAAAICLSIAFLLGGCGDSPKPKKEGKAPAAKNGGSAKSKAEGGTKKKRKKVDKVARDYARLARRAKRDEYEDLLALAKFCRKHDRYQAEARNAYERLLKEDPEDEEALDFLGLALVEDLPMPKAAQKKLVESAWFKVATAVVESEVKNEQRLRDVGLSYGFVPPFVIIKERLDDEAKDRRERRKLMALLDGLYPAFLGLVGDTKGLPEDPKAVVPVFWHRTRRAKRIFDKSRQLRHEETTARNPYWYVFDETQDTDAPFVARIEPLVRSLTQSMVSASLSAPTIPRWLEIGIAGHVSRVRIDQRDGRPIVECGITDTATLKSVLANEQRWNVERIVKRNKEASAAFKQLLKQLKEQGIDPKSISFRFGDHAPPDESWAFVAYLLDREPKQFRTVLDRVLGGEDDQVVVKEVFGDDLAAVDGAWIEWIKGKTADG